MQILTQNLRGGPGLCISNKHMGKADVVGHKAFRAKGDARPEDPCAGPRSFQAYAHPVPEQMA